MISFPNAKINLGLRIVSRRNDGFHNLESCFFPIQWNDILEIIPAPSQEFSSSGIEIPASDGGNLCVKAYNLLKTEYGLPPVHIHLHKMIPIGAGLGGGSSDAAFTLKDLNTQFGLNLSDENLMAYARKLGSDCAFFICSKPVMAHEKGDVFKEISISLKGKFLAVIYPGVHVSTGEAYAGVIPQASESDMNEILISPIQNWKEHLKNDFEYSVFKKYPEIGAIKSTLYKLKALYASMSGSGSAVYGIFDEKIDLSPFFPESYTIWESSFD